MARARTLTVTPADILKLEGLAQSLVDMDPSFRPKAEAVDYISQNLGVRRRTVQEWIRLARPAARKSDLAEAFFGVYERIAQLLSEQLHARMWDLTAPGERDAFRALQWLMPRVDAERFGETPEAQDEDDDALNIAHVPQEVFDALTPEELEHLQALQERVYAALDETELLIKTAQGRVLVEELAERQTH